MLIKCTVVDLEMFTNAWVWVTVRLSRNTDGITWTACSR